MFKRLRSAVILLLCVSMVIITTTSCSGSPETLGRKDAEEMNRAIQHNSANEMNKASKHSENHLKKYQNDRDKYFRYIDAYKNALE